MFIRLKLWRIHHCQYARSPTIEWPNHLLNICAAASNVMALQQRHRSDIKRNEELLLSAHGGGGIIIPTPMKIKQTIKTGFHDYIDGFTCIQTSCPTCPPSENVTVAGSNGGTTATHNPGSNDDKCLFINKTTGAFWNISNLIFEF